MSRCHNGRPVRSVEGGDAPLECGRVHGSARNHRVRVDVDEALQLGLTGRRGDLELPQALPVGERDRRQVAAVESGDHGLAGDDRSAGSAQGQGGHGAVVHPGSRAARGVESVELSVDGAHGHHPVSDRGRRKHLARQLRAPCGGAVRAGECNHAARAVAHHDQAASRAGASGEGETGFGLPEPLAGGRIVCRDVAVVAGGEQPAVGQHRSKVELLAVFAGGDPATPERPDVGRGLERFELRRGRFVLVVAQESREGAAAGEGERRREGDGRREHHAVARGLDVVRIAHRRSVHVNWMEGMCIRRDRRASSEPGRGWKARAPHRPAPSPRTRGPRRRRRGRDGRRPAAP